MNDQQSFGDPLLPGHVNSYRRSWAALRADFNEDNHRLNEKFAADVQKLWEEHCTADAVTGGFWLGETLIHLRDISALDWDRIEGVMITLTLKGGEVYRLRKESPAFERFDEWYLREISK